MEDKLVMWERELAWMEKALSMYKKSDWEYRATNANISHYRAMITRTRADLRPRRPRGRRVPEGIESCQDQCAAFIPANAGAAAVPTTGPVPTAADGRTRHTRYVPAVVSGSSNSPRPWCCGAKRPIARRLTNVAGLHSPRAPPIHWERQKPCL